MTDKANDVPMSGEERMDSARTLLSAIATTYMLREGGIPENGRGTIATDADGKQRIVGINAGFSRLDWEHKTSRTVSGTEPNLEIVDTSVLSESGRSVEHKQVVDSQSNPTKSKDEIILKTKDGDVFLSLKGECVFEQATKSKCTYDLEAGNTKAKAEVTTEKTKEGPEAARASFTKSRIEVNIEGDQNSETRAVELKYTVRGDEIATYEYEKK
ncbi:MAG: hypothetical protein K2X77_21875 [Candidatus Obscuribacterales bacterium]|jgi:hypothetical protein|nr:hypothetical protein [Candidatus Obscuribacterales bacterium]